MMSIPEYHCLWLDKEDIWNKADEIRLKNHCEGLPVDSELIAERLGLYFQPIPMRDDLRAYLDVQGGVIHVNEKHFDYSSIDNILRFTVAHEIGHYILHQEMLQAFAIHSAEEYLYFYENMPLQVHDNFEWQANEFAGRLVVPGSRLQFELDSYLSGLTSDQIKLLDRFLDDIKLRFAFRVSKLFQVTSKVIEIRLTREELWPPEI